MASCLSKTRMSIQLRVNSFARTITPLPPHEDCYVTDIAVSLQCRAFSMGPISIRPAFLIEREFSPERRCRRSPAVAREVCPQRVLQAAELPPSLGALALRPLRRLWGAPLLLAQLLLAQLLYHLPADFFESQFVSIQSEYLDLLLPAARLRIRRCTQEVDTGDRLVELGVCVGRCLHDMAAALWTFDVEQHARLLFRKQVAEGLAARHPKENPAKANGPNALSGVP